MPRPPVITDIGAALLHRSFPAVMVWNRLEGRPRTTEFDRALQAEIRDPLWMLARQWQFGEFRGEDAGSPVTATFHLRTTRPVRYQAQESPPTDLPDRQPLETLAEGRAVPFTIGPDLVNLDLRLAMGRRWMKLMSPQPPALRAKIMARWPISVPDPASDAGVPLLAHPEVWATLQAVAGRMLDGYELYQHLKGGGHPYDGVDGVTAPQQQQLDVLTSRFTGWFEDLIAQPAGPEAFDPARLEHRFTVAAPEATGETVLSAPAFAGGVLDWHAFSYDTSGTSLGAPGGTPADTGFLTLRSGARLTLIQRYIAANRAGEALNPAELAAADYRALADRPEADKIQIAQTLLTVCDEITPGVNISGPPVVAQAAVDVLKKVTPAPGDAGFLRLWARALHTLVRSLIAARRANEAPDPAEKAIQAYVSLAAVSDAHPVIVSLQNLSDILAGASLAAVAADAQQAAAQLLADGAPAPDVASAPGAVPVSGAVSARHGLAATAPSATAPSATAPGEGALAGADLSTVAAQAVEAARHDTTLAVALRLMDLSAQLAPLPGLASQAADTQQGAVDVLDRIAAAASTVTRTVVPGEVRYPGMPNPRWWAFEDGRTDFGAVTPDTTDLVKLMFLEFALVYSNDWFLLPCDLPAGTLARVDGVVFTDVFGQRTWIEPAGTGADDGWQRWSMYNLDVSGTTPAAAQLGLFLPPSAPGTAQGPPVEDVLMVRDEAANMVWGIERTVWLATGAPLPGAEAARETLAYRERLHPPPGRLAPVAAIEYQAMSTVPENWIPFVPVRVPGDSREIQLQRGAMPRVLTGPTDKVWPRTTLLRPGLDAGQPYFVHEEEVPRVGTRLSVAFNRARWQDGRVVVWLGVRRATGRGEDSGGLDWDRIVDPL
jgi:hypothetical protein